MIYDKKYNIPTFEDEDILDVVGYSEKLKDSLVTEFDKYNNTDIDSVYTKQESDNKYANAIKQELVKVKEAQIYSTGVNLQNVEIFGESTQETEPSISNPSPIISIINVINYKANENTCEIILPGNIELCGTDDIQDKIDNTGVIHKKLKKVLLTGTENWSVFNYGTAHVNTTMFNVTIADLINKDNSVKMCSALEIKKNTTETLNSDSEWIMCNSAKGVFISINNDRLESLDVAGFKNFLSTNNIEILIEIEEDITQSLTNTEKEKLQKLQTFEGINNITSNAAISAVYNTDTKNYIDSKFNALAEQVLNIVGGN